MALYNIIPESQPEPIVPLGYQFNKPTKVHQMPRKASLPQSIDQTS